MTALAITGGAEGKLQRPQWQPGQPPRRRIRFCYCTIKEWHNTRFSHAWTAPSQYPIPCWNFDHFSKHLIFISENTFENVVCCGMPAFCLRANEIRYQYLYYRQKPGIYMFIYIYIYSFEYRGCHYDNSTAPQVVTMTRCHKRPHSRHTDSPPPLFMCASGDFVLYLLGVSCDIHAPVDKSDTIDKIIFMNVDVMKQYRLWLITSSNYRCALRRHVSV